jgi:hypothetical protein
MGIGFDITDILHKIRVKFVPACLPDAKKSYNLKVGPSAELDIHGIASKASVYGITTPPDVIEEGLTKGFTLMRYLACDGFTIKTPLVTIKIRAPGEYDGTETRLPDGVVPEASIVATPAFRKYIAERVLIEFDGFFVSEGMIGVMIDEPTGTADSVVTIDELLDIYGRGLKVDADPLHKTQAWVFFQAPDLSRIRAKSIAVNEPRHLKVIAPTTLIPGTEYQVVVVTQVPVSGNGKFLKELREVKSEAVLTARN